MEIWPKGEAPSVVAPHFFRRRPGLTFCEGLRNNITLDFRESPALLETHIQRPGCFHYTLTGMRGICYGSLRAALTPKQEWQKFDFQSPCGHPSMCSVLSSPSLKLWRKIVSSFFKGPGNEDLTSLQLFFPQARVFCGRGLLLQDREAGK